MSLQLFSNMTCGQRSVRVSQDLLDELGLDYAGSVEPTELSRLFKDLRLLKEHPKISRDATLLFQMLSDEYPKPLTW